MEGALRGVRLCPTQQQAPSPPHLACPLLAVPFLVPWRANHPTRAEMAAPCAHRLARPTLRAHSYRTGSPGRAMQLSPWVHAQRHASPMWGSGPSRNTSCSLAHHGQSWGGGSLGQPGEWPWPAWQPHQLAFTALMSLTRFWARQIPKICKTESR